MEKNSEFKRCLEFLDKIPPEHPRAFEMLVLRKKIENKYRRKLQQHLKNIQDRISRDLLRTPPE
jgi:hypothetical protein